MQTASATACTTVIALHDIKIAYTEKKVVALDKKSKEQLWSQKLYLNMVEKKIETADTTAVTAVITLSC